MDSKTDNITLARACVDRVIFCVQWYASVVASLHHISIFCSDYDVVRGCGVPLNIEERDEVYTVVGHLFCAVITSHRL